MLDSPLIVIRLGCPFSLQRLFILICSITFVFSLLQSCLFCFKNAHAYLITVPLKIDRLTDTDTDTDRHWHWHRQTLTLPDTGTDTDRHWHCQKLPDTTLPYTDRQRHWYWQTLILKDADTDGHRQWLTPRLILTKTPTDTDRHKHMPWYWQWQKLTDTDTDKHLQTTTLTLTDTDIDRQRHWYWYWQTRMLTLTETDRLGCWHWQSLTDTDTDVSRHFSPSIDEEYSDTSGDGRDCTAWHWRVCPESHGVDGLRVTREKFSTWSSGVSICISVQTLSSERADLSTSTLASLVRFLGFHHRQNHKTPFSWVPLRSLLRFTDSRIVDWGVGSGPPWVGFADISTGKETYRNNGGYEDCGASSSTVYVSSIFESLFAGHSWLSVEYFAARNENKYIVK